MNWDESILKLLFTLENSGGGLLPLHKLDKHHTAFLVIDSRFCLVNNLKKETMGNFNGKVKNIAKPPIIIN